LPPFGDPAPPRGCTGLGWPVYQVRPGPAVRAARIRARRRGGRAPAEM